MTITSPFTAADGALTWVGDGETVRIEPWGANSIRVRARFMQPIADADWALLPPPADAPALNCAPFVGRCLLGYRSRLRGTCSGIPPGCVPRVVSGVVWCSSG